MKVNTVRIFIVLLITMTNLIFSQVNSPNFSFSIHAGTSFPYGDFGASLSDKAGYAKTGFSGMLEGTKKLTDNVNWVSSILLSINSLDERTMEEYLTGYSVTTTNYLTNWLVSGFGFSTAPSSKLTLYCLGQIGLLVSLFPDLILTDTYGDEINQTTETATAFGYSFGLGIKINKVNLSLRYYSAEPEYLQTATMGTISNSEKVKMPASMFNLLIGFNL